MGNNKKKNRGGWQSLSSLKQQTLNDEYNLENSFKKVRQYVKQFSSTQGEVTEQENYIEGGNRLVNSSLGTMVGPTESDSWNKYSHLDDKITGFLYQNETAHNQIRKDLGEKIDTCVIDLRNELKERLPIKWYTWTIAALVAFATLFYKLSYSNIINEQDKNSNEIKKIMFEINNNTKDIDLLFNNANLLEDSLSKKNQDK